jgi:hypothetical protein
MDKTIGQGENLISLIKDFIWELRILEKEHINLFREEMSTDISKIARSAIAILISLIIGYTGLFFLGILMISTFSLFMPLWAGLILVTILYFVVPAVIIVLGLRSISKILHEHKDFVVELKKTGKEAKIWLKNLRQ